MTDRLSGRNTTRVGTQQGGTKSDCSRELNGEAENLQPTALASRHTSDAELITLRLGSISAWPESDLPVAHLTRRLRWPRHREIRRLAQGTLSEARIDEAVEHVLELKLQLHLISLPAPPSLAPSSA
jgi:hypothetical protein